MKKEKKWQRFGRLNQKKIDEYLQNNKPLYEIAYLFPYLPTRSIKMSNTQAIRTFKTMSKKYKYCYKLNSDVYAIINQFYGRSKGSDHKNVFKFEEVAQIDSRVYVFTNISLNDLEDCDFEVVYINDNIYLRFHTTLEDDFLGIEFEELLIENRLKVKAVLQDMKDNKISAKELAGLEKLSKVVSVIPAKFDEIPKEIEIEYLKESTFYNFRIRFLLIEHNFYNTSYDMYGKQDFHKRKKEKAEDNYSIITKTAIDNSKMKQRLSELLRLVNRYGLDSQAAKENATFLHKDFLGCDLIEFLENESEYYLQILDNYAFLEKPYSKKYKHFFRKHRHILSSKFKTQQVFRKYKREYKEIENKWDEHREFIYWIIGNKIEDLVDKIYQSDIGANGLPNDGLHYDDIDHTEYGEDNILRILRDEKACEAELERILMAEADAEAEYWGNYNPEEEVDDDEVYYQEGQISEIDPLELFECDEEAYFEYYGSISIKEVLETKQLVVIDDVSLEGKFFSFQEMTDWLGKRLFHFTFT